MFLERLEIQGFKSFADKTVLKFDQGNTAVVGPNGSGKSNVADAIRWVLGEQSLKMLRGKKSEDVIFAGSDSKPQMSLAHVSLHMNNEDHAMKVDFPEVVITRKIYRSGESEYLINNSAVRLTDIVELLAKSGFGQKTYTVIGQGMIDAFITANPNERKILFEEAAGVKQYQLKRNQTIRKLELTRGNLARVHDLLNELRPRLKSLERQAKRAAEREVFQKELHELQVKWFSYFSHDIKSRQKEVNSQYIEAERRFKELEADYQEIEKKLHKESAEAGTDRTQYEKLQGQLADEQRKKNELETELARLSALIEVEKERDYSQDQKTLSAQKKMLSQELVTLRETAQHAESELDRIRKMHEEKEIETRELNAKIQELRAKIQHSTRPENTNEKLAPETKGELKELARAQKTLIRELETAQDISRLHEIAELAQEIHDRLAALSQGLDAEETTGAKEMLSIQTELTHVLELKESRAEELNGIIISLRTNESTASHTSQRIKNVETELTGIEQKLAVGKTGGDAGNITYLEDKRTSLQKELETFNKKISDTRNAVRTLDQEELTRKQGFIELEKSLRARREALTQASQAKNQLEVERARLEVRKEDLDREISEDLGADKLRNLTEEEQTAINAMTEPEKQAEHRRIEHLQTELARIGGVDEDVVSEHKEVAERFTFLTSQSEDLEKASTDLRKVLDELDITIKKKFNESFRKINVEFDKFFKILFNGGTAKLNLVRPEKKKAVVEEGEEDTEAETDLDEEDPTLKNMIEGVEIKANPPGKKLKNLSMLSGGEKAMTAIALLCAIIANNPSPFVVLDEVDAALDDANARRFARIIGTLDTKTQFIVITHNHETMRTAKILYGITMQRDGVSKMLSIKLDQVKEDGSVEVAK